MTVQNIERMLIKSVDGAVFINISQIARAIGIGRETAAVLVDGLEYFYTGRAKNYLVRDVAKRINERKQI